MSVRQLVGDCRVTLPTLDAGSVQAVVTSPPYYGLRDYGLPPLVWGAWLGSLGLEPTPDLYVEHLVEVFRHVRRVLRDDGVLWLNLGDSYNNRSVSRRSSHQGGLGFESPDLDKSWAELTREGRTRLSLTSNGLKEKDLMMMPFRVAMALQQDGWFLRSVIPWLKRNSMPESVADRPATSLEYVFLLAKSARYFWDADAVRMAASENTHSRGSGTGRKNGEIAFGQGIRKNDDFTSRINGHVSARNRRNSDWFFESWQGLLLDEQDDPLALVVNPAPFTGSHFATFPPKLVEPMIKASTHSGDTVLDPFGGAGTVGLVADRLQRNAILCELKPEYAGMGADRITGDSPMFSEVDVA